MLKVCLNAELRRYLSRGPCLQIPTGLMGSGASRVLFYGPVDMASRCQLGARCLTMGEIDGNRVEKLRVANPCRQFLVNHCL